MARVICPRCGKPHRKGERCKCSDSSPFRGRSDSRPRTVEQERNRKKTNPWRVDYSRAEYQRARQAALDRTGGRCAISGVRIADRINGRWVMRGNGGVHHIVPLSQGGDNSQGNLVPLETSIHNKLEAERRRSDASGR